MFKIKINCLLLYYIIIFNKSSIIFLYPRELLILRSIFKAWP